jgi:SsrA-binding protein
MASLLYNKKVKFNYEILETLSAGIKLRGFEVKALKTKKGGSLEGSHIILRKGEAFLVGAHIPPYQAENTPKDYDSRRPRKLLFTKKELGKILEKESTRGLTIVPISMYNKGNKIKVDVAVVKGKKKYDKRETIKKRDTDRDIAREIKYR